MSLAEIKLRKYVLNLGSHGGSYIDYRLLLCDAVSSGGNLPTFGRKPLFTSSVYEWRIAGDVYSSVTLNTFTRLHDVRFQTTVIYIKNCNAEYKIYVITIEGHWYSYVCPNFARS